MEDQETIRGKLNELRTEHRDLDQAIAALCDRIHAALQVVPARAD
jgi:hypothetical protein